MSRSIILVIEAVKGIDVFSYVHGGGGRVCPGPIGCECGDALVEVPVLYRLLNLRHHFDL